MTDGFLRGIRITVPFDISENLNKESKNIRKKEKKKNTERISLRNQQLR